jgi:hypothetical protein
VCFEKAKKEIFLLLRAMSHQLEVEKEMDAPQPSHLAKRISLTKSVSGGFNKEKGD